MEKSKAESPELQAMEVDDKIVRWIGVPFFGVVIPSASGLVNFRDTPTPMLLASYVYFIIIAFVVWEGNRLLLLKNYQSIFKSRSALQKYTLMLGLNVFFTVPVSATGLYGWTWIFQSPSGSTVIWLTVLIIVVCVIFITNIYEKVLLVKQGEKEKLRAEQLESAKLLAELEALKNQIDPHFMFNALNTVSYLIETDKEKARKFIENLADVYRYILKSKERDLVLLRDEIDFMKAYAALLKLRYEDAFLLRMKLGKNTGSEFLIPPVSLMVAVENAVKHNELSSKKRLTLHICQENNKLLIYNKISLKNSIKNSTRTGLKNLGERYLKTTGEQIEVVNSGTTFKLLLPLLKLHLS